MGSGDSGPLLRARLIAGGYRDDEVRRLCGRRSLIPVRPGAYVAADDEGLRSPEARHALMVRAAVQQLAGSGVVCHASAAVLLGISLWSVPLDRVHLMRDKRSGGRRSRYLHLHVSALDPDEIVLVDGIAVTSVARTVIDLARTLPFQQAVVVVDNALYRRSVSIAELAAALERAGSRRGVAAARRALAFADGLAESPGESRSRVAMHRLCLPTPVLQWRVLSGAGVELGRTDFGWPELDTVGEFDGKAKYGRLLRPGQSAGEAVFAEKQREDAIRDEGKRFVRWIWDELDPFDPVATRLRRAFRAP